MWFGRRERDEDSVWEEWVGQICNLEGRRCDLEGGWDEDMVWKERVGRRCGLKGVSGIKMWFEMRRRWCLEGVGGTEM